MYGRGGWRTRKETHDGWAGRSKATNTPVDRRRSRVWQAVAHAIYTLDRDEAVAARAHLIELGILASERREFVRRAMQRWYLDHAKWQHLLNGVG